MLLAIAIGIVTILLVPAYVLVTSQSAAYAGAVSEAEGQSNQFTEIESIITKTNSIATLLTTEEQTPRTSTLLMAVTKAANEDIVLTGFTRELAVPDILITGEASTRASLAAFKAALEVSGVFARVELPVASLASERDIEFTMTLSLPAPSAQ
jgi:hypothetical protein